MENDKQGMCMQRKVCEKRLKDLSRFDDVLRVLSPQVLREHCLLCVFVCR